MARIAMSFFKVEGGLAVTARVRFKFRDAIKMRFSKVYFTAARTAARARTTTRAIIALGKNDEKTSLHVVSSCYHVNWPLLLSSSSSGRNV
jgi:hypothetical protein